jgi:outer membrane lipase/esterase
MLASALFVGLGLSQGAPAVQFGGVYFFGDSLTDAGSFKPLLPPGTGKFTTNPGPVWAEVLAQRYGFTATPALLSCRASRIYRRQERQRP